MIGQLYNLVANFELFNAQIDGRSHDFGIEPVKYAYDEDWFREIMCSDTLAEAFKFHKQLEKIKCVRLIEVSKISHDQENGLMKILFQLEPISTCNHHQSSLDPVAWCSEIEKTIEILALEDGPNSFDFRLIDLDMLNSGGSSD